MRQQARNQRHALQQWPVMVGSVLVQLDGVIADLDQRLASVSILGTRTRASQELARVQQRRRGD